jgi:hypothetical protein
MNEDGNFSDLPARPGAAGALVILAAILVLGGFVLTMIVRRFL